MNKPEKDYIVSSIRNAEGSITEPSKIKENVKAFEAEGPVVPNFKMQERDIAIRSVSEVFGVSIKDIKGEGRKAEFFRARFAISDILAECVGLPPPRIGHRLGGRDHSTTMNAITRSKELKATDPDYAKLFSAAEKLVKDRIQALRETPIEPMKIFIEPQQDLIKTLPKNTEEIEVLD